VLLLVEFLLSSLQLSVEPSYAFDWDAYMEQVARMDTGTPRDVPLLPRTPLDAVEWERNSTQRGAPEPARGGAAAEGAAATAAARGMLFDYDHLVGDTGPMAYPAGHAWLHWLLSRAVGWDAGLHTTVYPAQQAGAHADAAARARYRLRTERPDAVIGRLQRLYQGAYLVMVALAWVALDTALPPGAVAEAVAGVVTTGANPSSTGSGGPGAGVRSSGSGSALQTPESEPSARRRSHSGTAIPVAPSSPPSRAPPDAPAALLWRLVLPLCFSLTRRVRAVPALGLFNDTWSMLLAHAAVAVLLTAGPVQPVRQRGAAGRTLWRHGDARTALARLLLWTQSTWRYSIASVLLSAAVSVKMNALLFAPGVLAVWLLEGGPALAVAQGALCAAVQLAVAAPFLRANATAYFVTGFNLRRVFDQHWSVNFRFLPASVFASPRWALLLLAAHVALLTLGIVRFLHVRRGKPIAVAGAAGDGGAGATAASARRTVENSPGSSEAPHSVVRHRHAHSDRVDDDGAADGVIDAVTSARAAAARDQAVLSPTERLFLLYASNFIGIAFARTLHYQFFLWYFHTLPFLFLVGGSMLSSSGPSVSSAGRTVSTRLQRMLTGSALCRRLPSRPRALLMSLYSLVPLFLFVLLLELAWNHHPPSAVSSSMVTALHLFLIGRMFLAAR
jgi:hypothetical protein